MKTTRNKKNFKKGVQKRSEHTNVDPKGQYEKKKLDTRTSDKVEDSYNAVNDFAWYNANPELVAGTGKVNFMDPIGYPMFRDRGLFENGSYLSDPINKTLAGMSVASIVHGPGTTGPEASLQLEAPVNVAARGIYNYMRSNNTGSNIYDANDVMTYFLALREVHFLIGHFQRVYGLLTTVNASNRYAPRAMVEALGFDYENLSTNKPLLRSIINNAITKIATYPIPNLFHYGKRTEVLYTNIFCDSTINKSQTYAFKPKGYRVFDETGTNGARLIWHTLPDSKITISQIGEILDALCNPIIGSDQSFGYIAGDILKSFTDLIYPSWIGEDYQTPIIVSDEIGYSLRNATIIPWDTINLTGGTGLSIYQNNNLGYGTVVYQPVLTSSKEGSPIFPMSKSFPIWTEDNYLDVERVYLDTRFMASVSQFGDVYVLDSQITEMIVEVSMALLTETGSVELLSYTNQTQHFSATGPYNGEQITDFLRPHATSLTFDWNPVSYVSAITSDYKVHFYPLARINNYGFITREELRVINEVCTMSLFAVPWVLQGKSKQ